ncbi:MAG: hypothetical protein HQK65_14350 [Desulfamplus sp.]|nr:hypothetical protein [Desulfamplus sp.]
MKEQKNNLVSENKELEDELPEWIAPTIKDWKVEDLTLSGINFSADGISYS